MQYSNPLPTANETATAFEPCVLASKLPSWRLFGTPFYTSYFISERAGYARLLFGEGTGNLGFDE
jgi:hypothetical protein